MDYTISAETLQDVFAMNGLHRQAWKALVKKSYPDTDLDNEVIGMFEHFTLWPGILVFFVRDGVVCKEPLAVKTRIVPSVEVFKQYFNKDRWVLLTVEPFGVTGEFKIRYAESDHDLL